jgi:phenylacetate-CoA ligase
MVEYQGRKLAALFRHCAAEVPYYRELFRRARIDVGRLTSQTARSSLSQLPLLEKETLRRSPDRFVADNASRFNPRPVSTSGTTGTPLTIYWDRGSNVMEFCSIQRLWRWAGVRIGHPFLDLRSRLLSRETPHARVEGEAVYLYNWKVKGLEFSSDLMRRETFASYAAVLRRHRPRLVRGHPQAIQHLASLARAAGFTEWRPHAVTTASEALYEWQRDEIERTWQVPVQDSYGLKEHNVFIAQCQNGSYHVSPEYGICEIVDDDGREVRPGEEGWIVATGLHNYAQPLLRYNTQDRAVAGTTDRCRCGRTLPIVERIVGRIDDCLYSADGRRFSGLSFAFFGRRGIAKARLTQETQDTVVVDLVTTAEFTEAERAALLDALGRKVDRTIQFVIRLVPAIQQPAGKFKFVVSKLQSVDRLAREARRD